MEEQKNNTENREETLKRAEQIRNMRRKAKWKLGAVGVTVLMCSILMLHLVVDKPTQAELTVIAYARENKISSLQYPEELIELLEDNPKTEEFVLNYPFRDEKPEIDLSTYDLKNGVPMLMQWDKRWGYMEYGDGMVCTYGSGPLCLAMAGYYVTGRADFYPDRIVKFARDNGFYIAGSGTKETLISVGGPVLGLEVKTLAREESKIAAYLQAGIPIIALVGPGDFTSDSHFIVLRDYEDGKLKINDPYSDVNSGSDWEFDEIKDQIKKLWVIQRGEEG